VGRNADERELMPTASLVFDSFHLRFGFVFVSIRVDSRSVFVDTVAAVILGPWKAC
jgi:hypothetical protein